CFLVFFLKAEAGIRDRNVTGVQTCALPISDQTSPLYIGNTPFAAAAMERTFDLDLQNNDSGAPGPDGIIDDSGAWFINLQSLLKIGRAAWRGRGEGAGWTGTSAGRK